MQYQNTPILLTTSPNSSINSTPAKGLRISQVLQKLSKNKDVDGENQPKKQLFEKINGNNINNRGTLGESKESYFLEYFNIKIE